MPRRIVPHVLAQHRIDEIKLGRPHRIRVVHNRVRVRLIRAGAGPVARRQQPLAVAPCVVVLGVDFEDALDEGELAPGLLRERDEQAPVVPDLVGLEELDCEFVH